MIAPSAGIGAIGGKHALAISREADRVEGPVLDVDRGTGFTRHYVPDAHRLVVSETGQQTSVSAEANGQNVIGMTGQRAQLAPRGHIPDLDRVVVAAAGEEFSVRAERH